MNNAFRGGCGILRMYKVINYHQLNGTNVFTLICGTYAAMWSMLLQKAASEGV